MKPKIGFMGLGIMGTPMAANLLKAGYPLMVYNRTPAKAEALAKLGAGVASSPRALAAAVDALVIMVTGPEALDALLWGPEGAAAALGPGKTLINMSSVAPGYTLKLAEKLAPSGVSFIDAPVSGSKKPAEEGTLIILAGGAKEQVTAMEALLLAMGKKVIYCGASGQGSMMKMFINLLMGVMIEGFAEALNFGKVGGLDFEAMLDTVFSGPWNCAMFQMKADNFRKNAFPAAFPLKHMTKDAKFVVDTAYETGAPVPAGQILLHLCRAAVARGWGDEDVTAMSRALEHLNPK